MTLITKQTARSADVVPEMWKSKNRKVNNCTHEWTASTSTYGLLRVVCLACGNVALSHIDDHIVELRGIEVREPEQVEVA